MRCPINLSVVMAGHSPSKTGVNALVSPAIHVFLEGAKQDLDARVKRGHDGAVTGACAP